MKINNKRKNKKLISAETKAVISLVLALAALSIKLTAGEQGEYIDGWGIQNLLLAIGLFGVFWLVRERAAQKNTVLNLVCIFFALFTVVGPSFAQTQSWNLLLTNRVQGVRTLILWVGYSLIYKYCILFMHGMLERLPEGIWRREARGKLERWLFEKNSFWGVVLIVWVTALPWLLSFFPGTLEPDARAQLHMGFGFAELTGHHPVVSTKLMSGAMYIGQNLFGSDNMGIFVYTFLQFTVQSLVFAYTIYVLGRIAVPIMWRWATVLFYCVFPLFPMWGYTVVKDTGYYLFILLFAVTIVHLLYGQESKPKWWQLALLVTSIIGSSCFRKDGCMVVMMTLLLGVIFYKKFRKVFMWGMASGLVCTVLVNGYMAFHEIPKGAIGEALSIPLQQTARYVWVHYDEITPDEKVILEKVFTVEVEELGKAYAPELSDPVKSNFIVNPSGDDLREYFGVWWKQLLKHPGTYVQAFLNQTYGYFFPDKSISVPDEDIAVFSISDSEYLNLSFGSESEGARTALEEYSRLVKRLPVIGMLYSVGMHAWILIGCVMYLLAKRRWKELVLFIPGVCVLAISVLSPVNTCVRYMLPVMALLPIHVGWFIKK